ncbi:MAG: hypothetical protein ACRCYS_12365, partial [Beijerinckiaceae bacterium]
MPNRNPLTPRELEILQNATAFVASNFRLRTEWPNKGEAMAAAERLAAETHRGAIVYAIGEVCGIAAS